MVIRRVSFLEVPAYLLLQADPSWERIERYKDSAIFYAVLNDSEVVAVCAVVMGALKSAELVNISVKQEYQAKGVGSSLVTFVLKELKLKGVKIVELGTGAFGYQLNFYHRLGFRVKAVYSDHFLVHYKEPIYENGIQHLDMLWLSMSFE